MCLVQLLPFWIAVTTAFKSPSDTSPPQITLPLSSITWENFASAITDGNILRAIFNSVVVTAIGTTVTCVLGAFAAYPLARYATRFNKLIYALIVALIMVPPLSILVPLYTLMANLGGGTNSYWGCDRRDGDQPAAARDLPLRRVHPDDPHLAGGSCVDRRSGGAHTDLLPGDLPPSETGHRHRDHPHEREHLERIRPIRLPSDRPVDEDDRPLRSRRSSPPSQATSARRRHRR